MSDKVMFHQPIFPATEGTLVFKLSIRDPF